MRGLLYALLLSAPLTAQAQAVTLVDTDLWSVTANPRLPDTPPNCVLLRKPRFQEEPTFAVFAFPDGRVRVLLVDFRRDAGVTERPASFTIETETALPEMVKTRTVIEGTAQSQQLFGELLHPAGLAFLESLVPAAEVMVHDEFGQVIAAMTWDTPIPPVHPFLQCLAYTLPPEGVHAPG